MEADLGSGFWVRAFATSLLWVLSSVGAEGPFAEGVYARPYRASIEKKWPPSAHSNKNQHPRACSNKHLQQKNKHVLLGFWV